MPNLDRFSRPGPYEKYRVKDLLLPSNCWVCGHDVDPRFLEEWNGIDACKYCIREIYEEMEIDEDAIYDND